MADNRVPNKPAAAGIAGSASIILVWIATQFNLEIPPEVAAAFVNFIGGLAFFLTPQKGV